jgi:lysophospholipase L1-like esterase
MAVFAVVAVVAAAGEHAPSAASASTPEPVAVRYDLALGDSLAAGVGASTPAHGYVTLLYRDLLATWPGLRLVDLGCSGATTTTFISGGGCSYADGSQLGAAEAFLRAHRGQTAVVTLDLGINDVDGCMSLTSVDGGCVRAGLSRAAAGIAAIVAGLQAADPTVPLVGSDYYDPFLAAWRTGSSGRTVARQSAAGILALDQLLTSDYTVADVPVARVSARFGITGLGSADTVTVGSTPGAVTRVCALTWMCSADDIHPNDLGHAEMAAVFDQVVSGRGGERPAS